MDGVRPLIRPHCPFRPLRLLTAKAGHSCEAFAAATADQLIRGAPRKPPSHMPTKKARTTFVRAFQRAH
jgi:hypothetical protein